MRHYSMGALLFATTSCGQATSVSDHERLQAEAARDVVASAGDAAVEAAEADESGADEN